MASDPAGTLEEEAIIIVVLTPPLRIVKLVV